MRKLQLDELDIAAAFTRNCAALGVECHTAYAARSELWPVFLPHFGGHEGMLVGSMNVKYTIDSGFHSSMVNPDAYKDISAAALRETLDDWGWFGPNEKRPPWYTGKPWT